MTTKKIPIEFISDYGFVLQKQNNYSHGYKLLNKKYEESADKNFIDKFMDRFELNDIEYRSLKADVGGLKKREEKQDEKRLKEIEKWTAVLEDEKSTKKQRYKARNKIAYNQRRFGKESTFGGLETQRQLTRECNKQVRDEEKIRNLKDKFTKARVVPLKVTGEANQKGNRFFDLSGLITDNTIIYKPNKDTKVEIKVNNQRNWTNDLSTLVEAARNGDIAVTVGLSTEHLFLTYDEQELKGYAVDERSRRNDVKEVKQQGLVKEVEKEQIHNVYVKYYDEQRERMLDGKIKDRCIAIDMNPTNIGYCILDKDGDDVKIVECGWYDISKWTRKYGYASDSKEQKYINNKRKYEITIIVRQLLRKAEHYQCSVFCMEDTEFKDKEGNHEFHRLTKNVWNRCLWENTITRRCNESGIELRLVNPAYTSFIGNIKYQYVDAVNASIEIGRRGLVKYDKNGRFYPPVTSKDIRTLEAKFGDVVGCGTACSWVELYKSSKAPFDEKEFSSRLRTGIDEVKLPCRSFSMNSYRSGVKCILFDPL